MADPLPITPDAPPAWDFSWLTPVRARLLLALILVAGFVGHLYYLHHTSIDLSGDEAQYWDWSRQLDLSYYSKGPGIAYIIRASCAIFGENMPAVRYPALVFAFGTSLVTYLLTRKLFGSDRLALGAVLLLGITPLVLAGSVLITIDPPMFFCWGLATYLSAIAIFDQRRWLWPIVGIVIGLGFLAKYITFVWFIGLFGFLIFHQRSRKNLLSIVSLIVALPFTLPVIIWNERHDWVSVRHVVHQTGTSGGEFSLMNILVFILGQLAAVGPTLVWIIGAAVLCAILRREQDESTRTRQAYLLWIGLPLLAINVIWSVRTKIQPNWPAPAYFSLIILAAHFLGTRLQSVKTWKPWRGWFWGTVAIGLVMAPIAHDTAPVLPLFQVFAKRFHIEDFDPLARVRGWRQLGLRIDEQLQTLRPGAFVLCDDYQQTAETAFYVPGQPKTFCAGSYFGKRWSQYDIWPDRSLGPDSPRVGKDAIYVGKGGGIPDEVRNSFASVKRMDFLFINVNGVEVKKFTTWECIGFKGLHRPTEPTDY